MRLKGGTSCVNSDLGKWVWTWDWIRDLHEVLWDYIRMSVDGREKNINKKDLLLQKDKVKCILYEKMPKKGSLLLVFSTGTKVSSNIDIMRLEKDTWAVLVYNESGIGLLSRDTVSTEKMYDIMFSGLIVDFKITRPMKIW